MIWFCLGLLTFNMPTGKATENTNHVCNSALGLEDGRIKDSQLSASSYYSRMYIYSGSIFLNTLARFGRLKNKYAWCGRDSAPYFQIDFGEMVKVTGLATQGFRANWNNNYVKTYSLKKSIDGRAWSNYSSPNEQWKGNKDGNTIQKNTLKSFLTRYLRIYPLTYSSRKCLRVEVYGCRLSGNATTQSPTQAIAATTSVPSVAKVVTKVTVPKATVTKATTVTATKSGPTTPIVNPNSQACNSALGLEDGRIKDSQLSASSYYSNMYILGGSIHLDTLARFGRLKNKYAWCADHHSLAPYFQIDFREMVTVTGLATQGFRVNWNNNYVKTYTLKYSVNGSAWFNYSSPNKQCKGNKDGNTIQKNALEPFQTRYLRIYPLTYSSRRCLRVEVYGCRLSGKVTNNAGSSHTLPVSVSRMLMEKSDTKTKALPLADTMKVTPSLSSTQNVSTPTKENKAVATSAFEANVMLLLGICVGCGMLVVVVVLVFMLLRSKVVRGTEIRRRSLELQSFLDGKLVAERFVKPEFV